MSVEKVIEYDDDKVWQVIQDLIPDLDKQLSKYVIEEQLTSKGDNFLKNALLQSVHTRAVNVLKSSKENKRNIKILETLTFEQEKLITELFPQFNLRFLGMNNNAHALPAAIRKLEMHTLLDKIDYNKEFIIRNAYEQDYVCDIGGNWLNHFNANHYAIHSCCPILNDYDDLRHSNRIISIQQQISSGHAMTDWQMTKMREIKFMENIDLNSILTSDLFCNHKAQHCDRTAMYGVMCHSNYDVPLITLADIMKKKKIKVLYGSFIFDSSILIKEEGFIEALGVHFKYVDNKKKICFSFTNDSSLNYIHKTRVYFSYVMISIFYDTACTSKFFLELLDNKKGIQFFKVTRASFNISSGSLLQHKLWFKGFEKKTIVRFFEMQPFVNDWFVNNALPLKSKVYVFETDIVQKGLQYALGCTEEKFRPMDLYNYLRSVNHRIIFAGVDILNRTKPVESEDLYALAHAIYIVCYIRKYDMGKVTQILLSDVKYNRDLLAKSIWGKLTTVRNYSQFGFDSLLPGLHLWLFNHKKTKEEFLVKISDHIKFLEYDSFSKDYCVTAKLVGLVRDGIKSKFDKSVTDRLNSSPLVLLPPDMMTIDLKGITKRIIKDNFDMDVNFQDTVDMAEEVNTVELKDDIVDGVVSFIDSVRKGFEVFYGCLTGFSDNLQNGLSSSYVQLDVESDVSSIVSYVSNLPMTGFSGIKVSDFSDSDSDTIEEDTTSGESESESLLSESLSLVNIVDLNEKQESVEVIKGKIVKIKTLGDLVSCVYEFLNNRFSGTQDVIGVVSSIEARVVKSSLVINVVDSAEYQANILNEDYENYGGILYFKGGSDVMELYLLYADYVRLLTFLFELDAAIKPLNVAFVVDILSLSVDIDYGMIENVLPVILHHVNISLYVKKFVDLEYDSEGLCGKKLQIKKVKGDGKCLFYSLNYGDCNIDSMVESIKTYSGESDIFIRDDFEKEINFEVWGGIQVILAYSEVFRRKVCIHSSLSYYRTVIGNYDDVIHIYYNGVHYDYLFESVSEPVVGVTGPIGFKCGAVTFSSACLNKIVDKVNLDVEIIEGKFYQTKRGEITMHAIHDRDRGYKGFAGYVMNDVKDYVSIVNARKTAGLYDFNTVIVTQGSKLGLILNVVTNEVDVYDHLSDALKSIRDSLPDGYYVSVNMPLIGTGLWKRSMDDFIKFIRTQIFRAIKFFVYVESDSYETFMNKWRGAQEIKSKQVDINKLSISPSFYNVKYFLDHTLLSPLIISFGEKARVADLYLAYLDNIGKFSDIRINNVVVFLDALKQYPEVYELQSDVIKGVDINYVKYIKEHKSAHIVEMVNKQKIKKGDNKVVGKLIEDLNDSGKRKCDLKGGMTDDCKDIEKIGDQDGVTEYVVDKVVETAEKFVEIAKNAVLDVIDDTLSLKDMDLIAISKVIKPICGEVEPYVCRKSDYKAVVVRQANLKSVKADKYFVLSDIKSAKANFSYYKDFESIEIMSLGYHSKGSDIILVLQDHMLEGFKFSEIAFVIALGTVEDHRNSCVACKYGVVGVPRFDKFNNIWYCCKDMDRCVIERVGVPPEEVHVMTIEYHNRMQVDAIVKNKLIRMFVKFDKRDMVKHNLLVRLKEKMIETVRNYNVTELCVRVGLIRNLDNMWNEIALFLDKLYIIGSERIDVKMLDEITSKVNKEKLLLRDVYSPKYVLEVDDLAIINNSMREATENYRYDRTALINSMKETYRSMVSSIKGGAVTLRNSDESVGLYDNIVKEWVRRPSELASYMCGYDGVNIVMNDIDEKQVDVRTVMRFNTTERYVMVAKATKVFNSDAIYNAIGRLDLDYYAENEVYIKLFMGVPGAGKSNKILDMVKPFYYTQNQVRLEDLILTTTREAAEDMRRRYIQKYNLIQNSETVKVLRKKIRTGDSFMIHGDDQADVIWIDEGLMRHAGDVLLNGVKAKAKEIYIFGDHAQIPFIQRRQDIVNRCSNIFHNPVKRINLPVENMSTSYRCPADVIARFNRKAVYPVKVTTFNALNNTVKCVRISNISEVPNIDGVVYLTCMQSDKLELKKNGYKSVFTVNEFQGNANHTIYYVRLNTKDNPVFKSDAHLLVAVSRHTKNFVYYTTVAYDMMAKWINELPAINEVHNCILSMKGGGSLKEFKLEKNMLKIVKNTQERVQFAHYKVPLYSLKNDCDLTDVSPDLNITVERVLQTYKQNRIIRDVVEKHGAFNMVSMRVSKNESWLPSVVQLPFISQTDSGSLMVLQEYYSSLFPDSAVVDNTYDYYEMEYDDWIINTDGFRLDMSAMPRLGNRDYLRPRLMTAIQRRVPNTQLQMVKAFAARNGNVPDYLGDNDWDSVLRAGYVKFFDSYIQDKRMFLGFRDNVIDINTKDIEEWMRTQPKEILKFVKMDTDNIFDKDLNIYNYILKNNAKPILDDTAGFKINSPQTIAFHDKLVNAVFCPIVKQMKDRLMAVMKENFLIFSDISIQQFSDILNKKFPPRVARMFKERLEIDFSKYDKSQGFFARILEDYLMLMLGFPPWLLPYWHWAHCYTELINMGTRFKARVNYQRKSGDAMTFFGNTLILMFVLAYVYDLSDDKVFGLFAGDDSYIFSKRKLEGIVGVNKFFKIFNFEAKLLKFKFPYFCSKFLLPVTAENWVVVPDLAKLIAKLGRKDLVDWIHMEEYRVSLCDLCDGYKNAMINETLSAAMCDRYTTNMSCEYALATLVSYIYNKDKFSELYYLLPGDTLLLDPSRPSLEI